MKALPLLDFFIDKITKSIEDADTGKNLQTDVIPVKAEHLKLFGKKNGWRFNWKKEFSHPERQVYQLILRNDTIVQGLISLQPVENYIELHLIETAPHNFGKQKKYFGVAGNLVAFACKLSFDLDFDGYVAFRAKTKLIQHYIDTLGAETIFKDRMCIAGNSAKKLVNSYYKP
jgi:hypothetical protein